MDRRRGENARSGLEGVAVDIGMLFLILLIIFIVYNSIYKGRYGG
jgi:uncharacterized integral membrane protein